MSNYAVINNSIVENIIVADTKELAELITGKTCIEYTDSNAAYIGLGYDGIVFEQPPIVEESIEEITE